MIVGLALLGSIAYRAWSGRYSREYYHTPIEMTGLYWHFVDIVWIFLFPLALPLGSPHLGTRQQMTMSDHVVSLRTYLAVIFTALRRV